VVGSLVNSPDDSLLVTCLLFGLSLSFHGGFLVFLAGLELGSLLGTPDVQRVIGLL